MISWGPYSSLAQFAISDNMCGYLKELYFLFQFNILNAKSNYVVLLFKLEIMEKKGPVKTDYLNLSALLKAEKNGYLEEQLALQRANAGSSGFTTESYVLEIIKMRHCKESKGLSVEDVTRKHFHGDY